MFRAFQRHPMLLRLVSGLATAALLVTSLPRPGWAQAPQPPAGAQSVDDLGHEKIIDALRTTIDTLKTKRAESGLTPAEIEVLRDAYVDVVAQLVYYSNRLGEAGRTNIQALLLEDARAMATECVRTPELRRTRPEPPYTELAMDAFTQARLANIGGFVIDSLEPRDATVVVGVDTLRVPAGGDKLADYDLIAGEYPVTIMADGYKTLEDMITVLPAQTASKPYRLSKPTSWWWWAGGSVVLAGAIAGTAVALSGGDNPPATVPDLDGPPPPP